MKSRIGPSLAIQIQYAPICLLLNRLEPRLRATLTQSRWGVNQLRIFSTYPTHCRLTNW
jgi:hypothetical protein